MNDRVLDEIVLRGRLRAAGVLSDPDDIERLLRAMAGSTEAQTNRSDTILIAAAEMIAEFKKITLELI